MKMNTILLIHIGEVRIPACIIRMRVPVRVKPYSREIRRSVVSQWRDRNVNDERGRCHKVSLPGNVHLHQLLMHHF